MKDTEQRGYEMFVRVRDYVTARNADFPPTSAAGLLVISLREVIAEIEAKAAEQSSGFSARRVGTASRGVARESLREQMEAISRTADALSLTTPGLEDRFRLPRNNNDQLLINTARAFARDALPFAAQFIGFGLPETFLADLNEAIEEFEQAINRQNSGRDAHVAATMAIDEALERGINLVRQLDAIVRNKHRDDPAQLAAWQSASRIERSPQRAQPQTPPPPTPPAP